MADTQHAVPIQPVQKVHLGSALRLGMVMLLIFLGCIALVGSTVTHWVEHQILTTNNWVAVVSPIPKQPVVASAISGYVTTQLFANVPVSQEIADALPPKASFLAGPLASQLQSLTNAVTYRVVVSDAFTTVWTTVNRSAMDQ